MLSAEDEDYDLESCLQQWGEDREFQNGGDEFFFFLSQHHISSKIT